MQWPYGMSSARHSAQKSGKTHIITFVQIVEINVSYAFHKKKCVTFLRFGSRVKIILFLDAKFALHCI